MFEQFVREGLGSAFSKENINIWTKEIVSEFLSDNKSLNEKIAHVAEEHNLNQDQIQRIVEATNLAVDSVKKGVNFEVAKTASVLGILKQPTAEMLPSMPPLDDYLVAPKEQEKEVDLHEMFGVQPQSTEVIPPARAIAIKITKLASAKKEIEDRLQNLMFNKEAAEKDIVKTAKQCIMRDHEDINELFDMVKEAGLQNMANEHFPIINHVLIKQGVLEKTAFVAPEELISEKLDKNGIASIKVINGNHAIIKSFQTMKRIEDDITHARKAIILAEDKISKLKEDAKRVS